MLTTWEIGLSAQGLQFRHAESMRKRTAALREDES